MATIKKTVKSKTKVVKKVPNKVPNFGKPVQPVTLRKQKTASGMPRMQS